MRRLNKKITPDKWKHFWAGIALGAVLQASCFYMIADNIYATAFAFAAIVFISYGFELFSKFTGKGHYEVLDAVASIIGGIIGIAIIWLI